MSESQPAASEQYFAFMSLPLEIRIHIYSILLTTSGSLPVLPPSQCPQILLVSKAIIRDEAIPILYSHNTFTVSSICELDWNHVFQEFLLKYEAEVKDGKGLKLREEERVKALWEVAQDQLVYDVGMIFNPNTKLLPNWLFKYIGCCECICYRDGDSEADGGKPRFAPGVTICYCNGLGYQFPTFLRRIGQINAATIRRIELSFGDLIRGADYLPIYAEILKQHVPRLRTLLIDFGFINDYGSDCEWDTPNSYGRDGREQLTDDAVVALFERLRRLFKEIPDLKELALENYFDGMEDLGEAIVAEKKHGKPFDIRKMWEDLTPLRDFGSGSGHPFPHPQFTNKGQGPEAFEKAQRERRKNH